jgi:parallel beta-helix repeat protein
MDIENVTIKGSGMDSTILSFKDQIEGAEGLFVRANGVTIEDLTIADTKGNGIKVQDSDGVTIRNVRVHWTGGPSELNGAYGLYPVGSGNVLVEHSEVSGASDAGIYVGQSEDVVVRHNTVFENVAGIEIENCIRVEVYENDVRNNTGGILVFDLPELLLKNGRNIRIHNNRVSENNHRNFAPEGNIVGMVPAGTGLLVMATDNVGIFDNEIANHRTAGLSVVSYFITQLEFTDPGYNPYPSGVFIQGNRFSREPALPDTSRAIGKLLAGIFGTDVPDVIHDGVLNPDHFLDDGSIKPERQICIGNNGSATVANINAPSGFADVFTDPAPYLCEESLFTLFKNRFAE